MTKLLAAFARPRMPFLALGLACFVFFLLHQLYVSIVSPTALYMDSLRLMHHLREFDEGRMTLLDVWGYGGASHRGLVFQLFLYANVRLFSLDVMLANRLTGLMVLLVGLAVALPYLKQNLKDVSSGARRLCYCLVAVLFVVLGYSPAGFELFTLDLGLPLWFKNLCFVAFFILHGRFLYQPTGPQAVLLAFASAAIVLVVAMGWAYAFAGATLAVHGCAAILTKPARSLKSWLPSVAIIISIILYIKGGDGAGDGVTSVMIAQKFFSAAWLACHAVGSTFLGAETGIRYGVPHWIPGLIGAGMFVMAIALVGHRLLRRSWSGSLLPIYLISYGTLVAVSVSYARGNAGYDAVMASRYYMDLYLFTVGTFWVWSEGAIKQGGGLLWSLIAALALLFGGQLATQLTEWRAAPYRREAIAAMNKATLSGLVRPEDAQLLQSPRENARLGIAAMRAWNVGVFRGLDRVASCDVSKVMFLAGWYPPEKDSTWMAGAATLSVPPCGCNLSANVYLPASFSAREIFIRAENEVVVRRQLRPGEVTTIKVPGYGARTLLEVESSAVTIPAQEAGGVDTRELSSLWGRPKFDCDLPSAVRISRK